MAKNQNFHRGRGPARGAPTGGNRGQGARGPDKSVERPRGSDPDVSLIWGFHAVREALRSTRRKLLRLHATEAAAARLAEDIAARRVEVLIATAQAGHPELPRLDEGDGKRLHDAVVAVAQQLAPTVPKASPTAASALLDAASPVLGELDQEWIAL